MIRYRKRSGSLDIQILKFLRSLEPLSIHEAPLPLVSTSGALLTEKFPDPHVHRFRPTNIVWKAFTLTAGITGSSVNRMGVDHGLTVICIPARLSRG